MGTLLWWSEWPSELFVRERGDTGEELVIGKNELNQERQNSRCGETGPVEELNLYQSTKYRCTPQRTLQ